VNGVRESLRARLSLAGGAIAWRARRRLRERALS